MSSPNWTCTKIIKKFKSISEKELEQRLAELWEILVERSGQFHSSQSLVPVKAKAPLLNPKRRVR